MLQESVDTTDVECLDSSSESANTSTPACRVDIIDEITPFRMRAMPAHRNHHGKSKSN